MDTQNTATSAGPMAAPVNPWRVPAPVLHSGKYGSVIIDRGELKKAVAASNNHYLFSETGPGVQPLVMVGTELQIMEFLLTRQQHGITSQIKSLPDIYMGISLFTPRARFAGTFPIGDTLVAVASYFASVIPVPDWVSLAASPTSLEAIRKSIVGLSDAKKQAGKLLYVKFSYLPEDGMEKIAKGSVSFKQVLEVIQKRYR
jgi:hypothetical protein